MVIHDLNIKPVASNLQFKTKKFTAKCDRKILRCGPVFFYYNPSIKALGSSKIDLKNVKSLEDNLPIEKISFEYITGDPKFISFLSGLKIGCFFISVLFLSFYYIKYKKVPVETRVIEQKMVLNLSLLVLGFNDPFYAIIMYKPSVFK